MKRLLPLILLAGCTATQSRHALPVEALETQNQAPVAGRVIDDFDSADAWHYYGVEGSVNPLSFKAAEGVMHLTSDSSAGLLWRELSIKPVAEPLLQWRWQVSRTFDRSSPLAPEFDNFPARLLVGFDSGWRGAGPAALAWRGKVEKATGVTPPARAICYTFGGVLESNEAVDAAFGEGRIVTINLRHRDTQAGEWHTEVRDIASDYAAIFGESAPAVMAMGLGCDSHRAGLRVQAQFDFIKAYGPDAYPQFRGQLGTPPQRKAPLLSWLIIGACALVAASAAGVWLWMRK